MVEQRPRSLDAAQVGTLAGAVFAALVGADPFEIRTRAHWVRGLDYAALALWVVVVVLFLIATATPARMRVLHAAFVLAGAAGLVTASALVFTAFGFSTDRDVVLVSVSGAEASDIVRSCRRTPTAKLRLLGELQTSTLDDEFLVLELRKGSNSLCDAIRIPRSSVLGIVEHPPEQVRERAWLPAK